MINTSKKRRNKRLWTGGLVLLGVLLVISYFVSHNDKPIDPASFANLEIFPLGAHEKGNLESDIRLIEYSDFQCPACRATEPSVLSLINQYGNQFIFEYRHFPLKQLHQNSEVSARASEAASIQGKFWEMHDILFEKQSEWSQSFNPDRYFIKYAQDIGLNIDRFRYDFKSDIVKDRVDEHLMEAQAFSLQGTPSFVYDGEIININEFIRTKLSTGFVEIKE